MPQEDKVAKQATNIFGKITGGAGIKNAAIEAGSVLLLNQKEVIREAQRLGTTLLGIT